MTGIVFWADSGAGVGLGHVARCCAVARELRNRGVNVLILCPDPRGATFACEQGEMAIEARYGFTQALDAISGCASAVIDSYRLQPDDYAAARRAAAVLVVFNDDGARVPACDVVVNGAPGAETLEYEKGAGTAYLLGAAYFPLRAAFRDLDAPAKHIGPSVERVLVTVGGDDVHGLLGAFALSARAVYPHAQIVAVGVPRASTDREWMATCDVKVAPKDYPALVRDADVIVCGAGQTLVEAAVVGTPAAAVLLGDDQRHQHAAVIRAGAGVDGGAWTLAADERTATLRSALERLKDGGTRSEISRRGRQLVDGRGADRIAHALMARADAISTPST
jgi:spore coat polysaccharide biosynthesis predicted glycosyltransferase SpsG